MTFSLMSTITDKRGKVIKEQHFIRLKNGNSPPIYVQNNTFYYEDGSEVKDKPDWLMPELNKCASEQLKAVNFNLKLANKVA